MHKLTPQRKRKKGAEQDSDSDDDSKPLVSVELPYLLE